MESQEVLRAATEKTIQSEGTDQTRLHITSKGREGKALRKKLAIALGLRVSSSGTPSTVDSEEEIEQDTSQNVMEMFRKQIKMTADQSKNRTKFNKGRQQVDEEQSSVLLRRTIRKLQTSRSEHHVEHDDGVDYQERSSNHLESTSSSRRSRDSQSQLSHMAVGVNDNTKKQLTSQQYIPTQFDHDENGPPSEDVFSSFGEQNESSSQISSVDSVKYLREKIRKNARARKLPRPKTVSLDTPHFAENKIERQRKLSGSQIPIRSIVTKTSEVKSEDAKENSISKSKIPRRISQNAANREDQSTKGDTKINSLLTEIFSTGETVQIPAEKLKVELKETRGNGGIIQDLVKQEVYSNMELPYTRFDDRKSAHNRSRNENNKSTLEVKVTNTGVISVKGITDNSPLKISGSPSHRETNTDLDAIISELENMKASLCKTYDDLHEMKEFTLGLRKELKEIRNI